jgi:dihydrolipoamide dehydrogenase
MSTYDVIVIGSGPGGYVAAIRAAHHGLKTAIVEKDAKLGGTCLLRGCIPTKSLLHSADLLTELKNAKAHGIVASDVGFDFAGVQKAREKVVAKSAAGVSYLMKNNKIDVHQGTGRFVDPHTVEVTGASGKTVLTAKHVIIATGSVPKTLPFLPVDGTHVLTSDELLAIAAPPKSMLVLGAGAVGVEFASVFSRFGTQCTIVEMLERCLPIEDEELSAELEKLLRKRGITIHTATRLESATTDAGRVTAVAAGRDGKVTLEAEVVLVAVGRAPFTSGLDLAAAGLSTNKAGFIEVDGFMQTRTPGLYAIGDVVPTPQLAHVASTEALLAVDHLAGKPVEPINYEHTPSCTYSDPEVASVGLSEREAKAKGYAVKVGKFPFSALGKARVMGYSDGFVKVVAESRYDELLGVHIIGPRATDLIAEAVVALRLESTAEALARTMHAHPTLPEAVLEAAHAAVGRPLHL